MLNNDIFKRGFAKKLRVPVLVIALMPHIMLLSMFSMNSTFTASFLDLEVDDLQFLFAVAYATIVCGLFVYVRLFHFFNIRSYLLVMTSANILVLFAMTLTTNTQLIFTLRFIQGPLALFEGVLLLPLIISQLKDNYARVVAYAILYCVMMTGDKFTTTLVKFAIENYNHNMMLYTLIMVHVVALLVYLLAFNHNRIFPKKPLYQLNISGLLLLIVSLLSGAVFFIYGRKHDWFESDLIVWSFAIMILFAGLFLLHQRSAKRPLFHFEVFASKRVFIGCLLFFLFYLMRGSMANIYQVMALVWQWPWVNVLHIQYVNVAGTIVGTMVTVILLVKKVPYRYIFALGFSLMGGAMLWFSYLFYPDIIKTVIYPPLFIQGFSQGILFTPLVLFLIGSVNPRMAGSVSILGTSVRYWSTIIVYAIMQNLVMHFTIDKQFNLSPNLDSSNPLFNTQWNNILNKQLADHLETDAVNLTAGSFQNDLFNQSLLLSNIDIFTYLFYIAIAVGVSCLFFIPVKDFFGRMFIKANSVLTGL